MLGGGFGEDLTAVLLTRSFGGIGLDLFVCKPEPFEPTTVLVGFWAEEVVFFTGPTFGVGVKFLGCTLDVFTCELLVWVDLVVDPLDFAVVVGIFKDVQSGKEKCFCQFIQELIAVVFW